MIVGTIISAVLFGLAFAIGVLLAGYPLWLALAIYSGGGVLCAMLLILRLVLTSAFEDLVPKTSIRRRLRDDGSIGKEQTIRARWDLSA